MAVYKVKSGETLTGIANSNNTSVSNLLKLNPSITNPNKISTGQSLNLPDVAPQNTATQTPANTNTGAGGSSGTTGGTASSTNTGLGDMSASFMTSNLQDVLNQMQTDQGAATTALGDTSALTAEHNATAQAIKTMFQSGQADIQSQAQTGQLNINRALETLQLSPGAISTQVQQFNDQVRSFQEQVTSSYERLDSEQAAAMANNDASYAQNIQQAKLSLINTNLSFLQNRSNILSTIYGLQTSNLQAMQANASNNLNTILQSMAGTPWDSIPAGVKQQITDYGNFLGISPEAIQTGLQTEAGTMALANQLKEAQLVHTNTLIAHEQTGGTLTGSDLVAFGLPATMEGMPRSTLQSSVPPQQFLDSETAKGRTGSQVTDDWNNLRYSVPVKSSAGLSSTQIQKMATSGLSSGLSTWIHDQLNSGLTNQQVIDSLNASYTNGSDIFNTYSQIIQGIGVGASIVPQPIK